VLLRMGFQFFDRRGRKSVLLRRSFLRLRFVFLVKSSHLRFFGLSLWAESHAVISHHQKQLYFKRGGKWVVGMLGGRGMYSLFPLFEDFEED